MTFTPNHDEETTMSATEAQLIGTLDTIAQDADEASLNRPGPEFEFGYEVTIDPNTGVPTARTFFTDQNDRKFELRLREVTEIPESDLLALQVSLDGLRVEAHADAERAAGRGDKEGAMYAKGLRDAYGTAASMVADLARRSRP